MRCTHAASNRGEVNRAARRDVRHASGVRSVRTRMLDGEFRSSTGAPMPRVGVVVWLPRRPALKAWAMNLMAVVVFLGAGLWLGPHAGSAYDQLFPAPAYVSGDYDDVFQRAAKSVVMFSTSTCPYCQRTRELLRTQRVDYEDLVIDQSPDAKRLFERFGGGAVPLLFIGDRRITGFQENTIVESLALILR
jgi:glutaredoxin